jgi:hypothetical protein
MKIGNVDAANMKVVNAEFGNLQVGKRTYYIVPGLAGGFLTVSNCTGTTVTR